MAFASPVIQPRDHPTSDSAQPSHMISAMEAPNTFLFFRRKVGWEGGLFEPTNLC